MMAKLLDSCLSAAGSSGTEEMGQLVIMAGLRAPSYLMRQNKWGVVSYFLEAVIYRDESPKTIASVLPF